MEAPSESLKPLQQGMDAHDAAGLSKSLVDDAQFVTVNGDWSTSREEFRGEWSAFMAQTGRYGPARAGHRRCRSAFLRPTWLS